MLPIPYELTDRLDRYSAPYKYKSGALVRNKTRHSSCFAAILLHLLCPCLFSGFFGGMAQRIKEGERARQLEKAIFDLVLNN